MASFSEVVKGYVFKSDRLTRQLRRLRVLVHYARPSPHEADFAFLAHPSFANAQMLDLGANIGQSAISACKVQPGLTVVSIEANPACEPGLQMTARLLGPRFQYRIVGVGELEGQMNFHVPVRASRMLLEEGTFLRDSLATPASVARIGIEGADYQLTVLRVPLIAADSLALRPRVIKMDLQGLELPALRGLRATLTACHPAVMVEVGEGTADVAAYMATMGYVACHWDGQALRRGSRAGLLNTMFLSPDDPALPDRALRAAA